MAIEEFKSWYLKYYRESPVMMFFLTIMSAVLLVTVILSAVSRDYFLSVIGKMSQHVFMDYFWSVSDSINNPYTEYRVIYPPLAVCIYSLIGRYTLPFVDHAYGDPYLDMYNSQVPMILFIILLGCGIFLLLSLIKHALPSETDDWRNVLFIALCLLSLPMIIAIQNGNNIIYIAFLSLLFLLGYNSEKKWIRYCSYIILGIIAGFKFLPALLGLLIIREGRYKEFLFCVVIAIIIALGPIIFTDGTLQQVMENILTIDSELGGSINNISKISAFISDSLGVPAIETVGTVVLIIVMVLGILILAMDRQMKLWKLVTLAACLFILGPGVGTPYMYIYLIPAIVFLVRSESELTTELKIYIVLISLPLMLFSMDVVYIKVGATVVLLAMLLYEGVSDLWAQFQVKYQARQATVQ